MTLAGIPQATIDALTAEQREILAKMYDLAKERSFYGQEIVFRRCQGCGVEETLTPAGRIEQQHDFARHFGADGRGAPRERAPLARPMRVGDVLRGPRAPFGARDDD